MIQNNEENIDISSKSGSLKGDIKKWKYACKNEKDYEIWLDILEYITNSFKFYQKYNTYQY